MQFHERATTKYIRPRCNGWRADDGYLYIYISRIAMVNIISHWEWEWGLQETTNLQEQYARRASHFCCFLLHQEFSFILNDDLTNPFFPSRAHPLADTYPNPSFVSSRFVPDRKAATATRHIIIILCLSYLKNNILRIRYAHF